MFSDMGYMCDDKSTQIELTWGTSSVANYNVVFFNKGSQGKGNTRNIKRTENHQKIQRVKSDRAHS